MKPTCAGSLMERLAVSDAVAGDIVEQFQGGRSWRWLWRQPVLAIGSQTARTIRNRPIRVVGAFAAGWDSPHSDRCDV